MYDPSYLAWNFPFFGLALFSKTLLKTNSPDLNAGGFTHWLCRFASLYWYDAMRTAAAPRSSSVVSRYLVITSAFASSEIPVRMVSILIFVGMIAYILKVRENGDSPVGF